MQTTIVLTGGPSAGKTTLITLLSNQYGARVAVAPEAASQLFAAGHARPNTSEERLQTQRLIFALQKELETHALQRAYPRAPIFCDRGSLDGSAYWPGCIKEFCFAMGSTIERELSRYTAIIHLQAADEGRGYTNTSIRTETAAEAALLDQKVGDAWSVHPNYIFIPNQETFLDKVRLAMTAIKRYLPDIKTDEIKLPEPATIASVARRIALPITR